MTELSHTNNSWEANLECFQSWLDNRVDILEPGLVPEPTIKVLIFLALIDANKPCTYDDLRDYFKTKNVIRGKVPDNTLRTSVSNLGKTLEKSGHAYELKASRGRFQLKLRSREKVAKEPHTEQSSVVLLLDPPAIRAEDIALTLIEKAMLPFHSLYFLEWSARWWETYSSKEAEARVKYEADAWERLGIKKRLLNANNIDIPIGMVGLAPGEGLAEIELLKKILRDGYNRKVHYIAVDSSQRLLRDHIGLLKETLTPEIESGQLLCAGVIADIFTGLSESIDRVKNEFVRRNTIKKAEDFLPSTSGLIITYLGNCLGNNYQDQETEIFSIIHSIFQNRPLDILIGVSVMRSTPDKYKRNWDDFLLQTPRHLLETKKLLVSSKSDKDYLTEFLLSKKNNDNRCPPVLPETYIVRHQIEGQIYRFYYTLSFDLKLIESLNKKTRPLPAGTLILLYSIIKYKMEKLVDGIKRCGLFNIEYDSEYHQVVDTANGIREYAVFTAYSEK